MIRSICRPGDFGTLAVAVVTLVGMASAVRAAAAAAQATTDKEPLNVVLILADDLGWTDLSCFGSDFYKTPNIDLLASEGVRFTQNYSACTVCSPTRAALMTGKYPGRLRVTDWIPGRPPDNPKLIVPPFTQHLPLEEVTIAELFKKAGYATASIGKWHLGEEPFYPEKQGFDVNVAGTDAGSPSSYIAPWEIANLAEGKPGDYLTDRLGVEAVQWLDTVKDKPFFLYLSHFAVHTPIQAPDETVKAYEAIDHTGKIHTNATYAAMLDHMDRTVGQVRAKIDALGLTGRTVIIFTSDNGGHLPSTSNKPLRVGKGSCYEGGVRVPMIAYWPGVTQAGRSIDTPVMTIDLYPTLAEIAGLKVEDGHRPDGVSLAGLLRSSGGTLPPRDLIWHYPHYQLYQQGGTVPYAAIRSGDFKLIEFFDGKPSELYDIAHDLSETKNVIADKPDLAREMSERLHAWQSEADVQMPVKNPEYDPAKPEYNGKKADVRKKKGDEPDEGDDADPPSKKSKKRKAKEMTEVDSAESGAAQPASPPR